MQTVHICLVHTSLAAQLEAPSVAAARRACRVGRYAGQEEVHGTVLAAARPELAGMPRNGSLRETGEGTRDSPSNRPT
jgi:hypothetical protein